LFLTIPIVEGWDQSYENATVHLAQDREMHFGQFDHLRLFGADFRAMVADARFSLDEYTAFGPQAVKYSLIPGEKVFVCTKA
jgi:hypothetical protein